MKQIIELIDEIFKRRGEIAKDYDLFDEAQKQYLNHGKDSKEAESLKLQKRRLFECEN